MKLALLFPGQAAQFVGMGKQIVSADKSASDMLARADDILGYTISDIMEEGPEQKLKETRYTQPAVFIHSMLIYEQRKMSVRPEAVAGHSLGEISACVAAGVFTFEDGLRLVQQRADAMHQACIQNPSTMAAIIGLDDTVVEEICSSIEGVVAANYNYPGQIVISGSREGIQEAIIVSKENGARRALEIAVGGAFHSPFMQPVIQDFEEAIGSIDMAQAKMPVYQNVNAQASRDPEVIRRNLIDQVVNPVKWALSIQNMISDGFSKFIEVGGKGKVLMGMLRKISREIESEMWVEE